MLDRMGRRAQRLRTRLPGWSLVAIAFALIVGFAVPADAPARPPSTLAWSPPIVIDDAPPINGPRGALLSDVSCPSASLCVAADYRGNVVTSTDPSGGASAWTMARVDDITGLSAVSCPSSSLCAATELSPGRYAVSTDPAGGTDAWSFRGSHDYLAEGEITGISCASTSLCVAVDTVFCQIRGCQGYGEAIVSTDPTGGAWEVKSPVGKGLWSISCPSNSLCVATAGVGDITTSSDPGAGSASTWTTMSVDHATSLAGISCPSLSLCVTVGANHVATSREPAGGKWAVHKVAGSYRMIDVSCASESMCAAVGTSGKILASTEPAVGDSWMPARLPGVRLLHAVSCPSRNLCVALGERGRAVIGTPGPPDSAITVSSVMPKRHKARFRFEATRGVATRFQCKLTKRGPEGSSSKSRYRRCTSPATYRHLHTGRFVLKVRARNTIGPDPTPAAKSFRIRR
jgi:hypothetical protein